MNNLIILEYKESKGQWHYNPVYNNEPKHELETDGWESIAYTEEKKARYFTYMIDCKNNRRKALKQSPYSADFIRKEWKHFCYVYNSIIKTLEITPDLNKIVSTYFDETEALARLGHSAFSDVKEDKELPWAWEYDPYSYKDSNF